MPAPLALLLSFAAAGALACVNAPPPARTPHGDAIRFEARSGIARAHGIFHDWRIVDAHVDRSDPGASWVEIEVDVASVDTAFARRDEHLRAPDFFDARRWPGARIRVSEVRALPESEEPPRYAARFEITLRDTRESLPGSFTLESETPLVVAGELVLDRTVFGVGEPDVWWNPMSPHNDVTVRFRATLDPQP
jgi:polyisoprenoid-binding protein YceI